MEEIKTDRNRNIIKINLPKLASTITTKDETDRNAMVSWKNEFKRIIIDRHKKVNE